MSASSWCTGCRWQKRNERMNSCRRRGRLHCSWQAGRRERSHHAHLHRSQIRSLEMQIKCNKDDKGKLGTTFGFPFINNCNSHNHFDNIFGLMQWCRQIWMFSRGPGKEADEVVLISHLPVPTKNSHWMFCMHTFVSSGTPSPVMPKKLQKRLNLKCGVRSQEDYFWQPRPATNNMEPWLQTARLGPSSHLAQFIHTTISQFNNSLICFPWIWHNHNKWTISTLIWLPCFSQLKFFGKG